MSLPAAFIVSALCGFVALSYEIIWIRVYSFFTEGPPPRPFGFLLSAYLMGLGVGAWIGGKIASSGLSIPLSAGAALLTANAAGFLVVPAVATFAYTSALSEVWALPLFGAAATLLGIALPLVSHLAVPADERAGSGVSIIYLGNILGSASGSLTTGFLLFEILSLEHLCVLLAILGLAVSGILFLFGASSRHARFCIVAGLCSVVSLTISTSSHLYSRVYEKLLYRRDLPSGKHFARIVENRSGIVTVSPSGTVYGNGSYDGAFNTSPIPDADRNRIVRAYALSAFHPNPKNVLMIGVGSGSWAQVIANHPSVKSLTVVEINPGYFEAIRANPKVASVLKHPAVEIVTDDGRRYMNRTERRFDVIVQNTIVYWRANSTNLLSREYLELTRLHLKPGGVVYYNTTMSVASQKTGASVFPHAWRFQNMLIASDSPIRIDRGRWQRDLASWQIDGRAVLRADVKLAVGLEHGLEVAQEIVGQNEWRGEPAWEDRGEILRRTKRVRVITDDNMATEWSSLGTFP